jgi:hypothetical protein
VPTGAPELRLTIYAPADAATRAALATLAPRDSGASVSAS